MDDLSALEPLVKRILTESDPKVIVRLLFAGVLVFAVWLLREKIFNKWGRKWRVVRWLADTNSGGVVMSIVLSGIGATASALATMTVPNTWGVLNAFLQAALASGFASWKKAPKKDREDKEMIKEAMSAAKAEDEKRTPPEPPPLPPAALVIVLASAMAMGGCATARTVSYNMLGIAANHTAAAAQKLPSTCEAFELAAAQKVKDRGGTKDQAIAESGLVHADCEKTLKVLATTGDGIATARDAIVKSKELEAQPTDIAKWLSTLIQLYNNARPILARWKIPLPEVK